MMTAPRPRLRRSLTASAVVAAMLALAACGSTGGPGESSGAGTSSSAAGSDEAAGEPTTGGTLEVGFAEDIANYDPHQRPQLTARTISRQIADTLTDQDPETGEIVPFLAESWEISDDATEFTFTLREDATFSDGTPVDAAAVKANFDRIIEIGALSYVGAGLLRNYTGSEVLEPYVVKVSFSEPNAQFLQATSVASLSILAPATLGPRPRRSPPATSSAPARTPWSPTTPTPASRSRSARTTPGAPRSTRTTAAATSTRSTSPSSPSR